MLSISDRILRLLTLTTLLWALFFLNIILPDLIEFQGDYIFWNVLYLILLICSLVATLILIAESFRKQKSLF